MEPNEDANGPDASQDVGFSDLPPEDQQEILAYMLQGKPRNPNTVQQAKTALERDPEMVETIAMKIGLFDKDGNPRDSQPSNEEEQDDGGEDE